MARQTLVLLPGLLNTRRLYERQIADLADLAEAIVPELWHHESIGAMAEAVWLSEMKKSRRQRPSCERVEGTRVSRPRKKLVSISS